MKDQYGEQYATALQSFQKSVAGALAFHAKVRNLPLQGISPMAHLMYARIFFMSASVLRLCPKIEDEHSIWDFASMAILSRSLFEAVMFFLYFCEPGDADEWVARMMLVHLHDRCERVRLFTEMNRPDEVNDFAGEADELRMLLQKNGFFQKLDEQKKKRCLNGYNPAFLTLREMADKYAPPENTWAVYQLLSGYVHSYPIGFIGDSHERRDGLPNEKDKAYIPVVISWIATLLDDATAAFQKIPAGV